MPTSCWRDVKRFGCVRNPDADAFIVHIHWDANRECCQEARLAFFLQSQGLNSFDLDLESLTWSIGSFRDHLFRQY